MIQRIEPMCAATVKKEVVEELYADNNWVAEEKFNGARYLLHLENEGNKLFSRGLSTVDNSPIDKAANVPHITGKIYPRLNETVLDGEIVGTTTGFQNANSIMGSKPEKALIKQAEKGNAIYKVFDILYFKGKNVEGDTLYQRRHLLEQVVTELNIKEVECVSWIGGEFDKRNLFKRIISVKGEGIILKNLNAQYEEGGRGSHCWVKVKKTNTWDVVIMGYTDPEQFTINTKGEQTINKNYKNGWIRAVVTGVYDDGNLIAVGHCSGFTDRVRKDISENKNKYLGQVIEVKGQEILELAIINPRFIQFRPDVNPNTCTLQKLLSQK